ncbi:MAG: ABC-2 transporter permease [Phycisphaerales bacterium]
MLGSTATIARSTFVESIRQPVFFIMILVSALLQVLNTWISGFSMGYSNVPGEVTGDNKLLFDIGLSTVFVCGTLLAAFIATAVLSREIENKTILTIVSKPVGRPAVVIGKYLGVAGAMAVAVLLMTLFLMYGIRHGVLSTAADDPDQPVIFFSFGAVALSLLIAAAGNYLYGWAFGQTTIVLMVPLTLLGYVGVLLINKDWELQPLGTDIKPQLLLACLSIAMALLVLTAIATAASTRLGQVMTITICAGVFVLGLLSNFLIGRHVFQNEIVGEVVASLSADPADETFDRPGDEWTLLLKQEPTLEINVGDLVYWGPSPNGAGLDVPPMTPPGDDVNIENRLFTDDVEPAVVISAINARALTIKQIGREGVRIRKAPAVGDFVFPRDTTLNPVALAAWSAVPNMHYFWNVDAITQAKVVPASHTALAAGYAVALIVASLSIAVILFQGRDVG